MTPQSVVCKTPLSMGFSGKNTGVGCHSLLQRIFPTQGSKPPLLCPVHCRYFFFPLSHLGSLHLVVLRLLIRFFRWFTKLPFILIHFIIFLKRVSWENIPWFLKKSVSVQFSCSVMSYSLRPHELQHARPPCPLPTPGIYTTHVHRVGDAIQPSHPLLSPSPPGPNPSQQQGLFQWISSSHQVTKVLEFQLQHQFFQRTVRTDLL